MTGRRQDRNERRQFDTTERPQQRGPATRAEPSRGARRPNDDVTRRAPAPRTPAQPERRFGRGREQEAPSFGAREREPRRGRSAERPTPERKQRRMESAAPRDAVPVPVPRGGQSRLERRRAPEPRMANRPTAQPMARQQAPRRDVRPPQPSGRERSGGQAAQGRRRGGHGHAHEGG